MTDFSKVSRLLSDYFRRPRESTMKRLNLFSLFYLGTAAAFAAIALAKINLEASLTAGFALLCAVLSLFPWWRQVILRMDKRNSLIFDWVAIAIALSIQGYGLLSHTFGWSYLVIGYVILTVISTVEDVVVLRDAAKISNHHKAV